MNEDSDLNGFKIANRIKEGRTRKSRICKFVCFLQFLLFIRAISTTYNGERERKKENNEGREKERKARGSCTESEVRKEAINIDV